MNLALAAHAREARGVPPVGRLPLSVKAPAAYNWTPMHYDPTPALPRGFRCASRNVGLKLQDKDLSLDRKSTRLNSSHVSESRMPSSA